MRQNLLSILDATNSLQTYGIQESSIFLHTKVSNKGTASMYTNTLPCFVGALLESMPDFLDTLFYSCPFTLSNFCCHFVHSSILPFLLYISLRFPIVFLYISKVRILKVSRFVDAIKLL